MTTAQDCQRLLATQPLLDQLSCIDTEATAENLRNELFCPMGTLLNASVRIADAGHNDLLATIRTDVAKRLPRADQTVLDAASHSAFAAAFGDLLDTDTLAELSLPWALSAVTLTEDGEFDYDDEDED